MGSLSQKYIIPYIGKVKLANLKPSTLEKFYIDLMNEHNLSAKSVKYVHNVLKSALSAAVADKILEDNVCSIAKTPKVQKYEPVVLSIEELQKLLDYVDDRKETDDRRERHAKRYCMEINLAVRLGLRRGEVLGLKYSDFDFDRHTVTISRQVSSIRDATKPADGKYYGLKSLKSQSSHRVLYIDETIENLVKRKRVWYEYQRKICGDFFEDSDLVCCNDDGSIKSPQTLLGAYKQILKKCGLPNVRFHDLRHSYAVLCIDLNVPIKALSQALGHSSTSVTDSVYADSIRAKRELANLVGSAMDSRNSSIKTYGTKEDM